MYKRLFLILLCMQNLLPVFAVDWRATFPKRYVDFSSVSQIQDVNTFLYPNRYLFWEKRLNDNSMYFKRVEKLRGKKVWYALSRLGVDCHKGMYALYEDIPYDLNNTVIMTNYKATEYTLEWQGVPPGTIIDYYYKWLCAPY